MRELLFLTLAAAAACTDDGERFGNVIGPYVVSVETNVERNFENGAIRSDPEGINCPGDICEYTFGFEKIVLQSAGTASVAWVSGCTVTESGCEILAPPADAERRVVDVVAEFGPCEGGGSACCVDADLDGHLAPPCGDDCDDTQCMAWNNAPDQWDTIDNDCSGKADDAGPLLRLNRYVKDYGNGDREHRLAATGELGSDWLADGHWMEIYHPDLCTVPSMTPVDENGQSICVPVREDGVVDIKPPCWGGGNTALASLMECSNSLITKTFYVVKDSLQFRDLSALNEWRCERLVGFVVTNSITAETGDYRLIFGHECDGESSRRYSEVQDEHLLDPSCGSRPGQGGSAAFWVVRAGGA
jgi:hypothetical protein